jgi:transposase
MPEKQAIRLSRKQREALHEIIARGKRPARTILRAHILLRSADGWTDNAIAQTFETSGATVRRMRQRCVERGVFASLSDAPRKGAPHKLDEEEEARLVALACSDPPHGRCRWTVRLLTEEAVKQSLIRPISPETARQVLQKTRLSLGKSRVGVMRTSRQNSWPA